MKYCVPIILFVLVIFFLSCDKPKDHYTPPPPLPPVDTVVHVTGLLVEPTEFLLVPSLTWQLTANITPANADNKGVTWISSDNSVATVSGSGLVTAIKVGAATITATSKDKAITATATLIVVKDYEVYAVGNGHTFQYLNCALYWKNGKASLLPGGTRPGSDAFAILFSGNDEYIAGNTINSNLWGVATYWKNGVPHVVGPTNIDNQCWGRAIAAEGNKVVVAGSTFYDNECPSYCFGRSRAFYWTDSAGTITQTGLYNDISSTRANGVAFKDGNILIAGAQANDNFFQWATWWKNDTATSEILSPVNGFYATTSITVRGTDIYYTGYGGCPNIGCNATAFLWKNDGGNTIRLTDGSRDAQAQCIAFSGSTIYIGGYEKNEVGRNVAKYWRIDGSTIREKTLSDGTKISRVNGIAVSGDDIFLIGSELSDAGDRKAKCWRAYEGAAKPLSLDASDYYLPQGREGHGIYIK
ncbi:MAG: hypothetical protein JWM28_562 [Chitinophagaceae bacterium]|nr:hypothetical protein [Chitinophagaceae bacterium]